MKLGWIVFYPTCSRIVLSATFFTSIFLSVCSVNSLEESLCMGTGYYLPGGKTSKGTLLGYKSPGWKTFFDRNVSWASVFWVADHRRAPTLKGHDNFVSVKVKTIADHTGQTMAGWLGLEIFRMAPFQFVVIWAITQDNEAYGRFVFEDKLELHQCLPLLPSGLSYVNCSAIPIYSDVNPNIIISANIKVALDREGNVLLTQIPSYRQRNNFSVVWHASKTHCFGPEKFRFMIASSSKYPWNSIVDWSSEPPFADIGEALGYGPIIQATPWITPSKDAITSDRKTGPITCKEELTPGNASVQDWITKVEEEALNSYWFDKRWNDDNTENMDVVKKRSTCRGAPNGTTGFVGRCSKQVNPDKPEFVYAVPSTSTDLECPTKEPVSPRVPQPQISYSTYIAELYLRLNAPCECPIQERTQLIWGRSLFNSFKIPYHARKDFRFRKASHQALNIPEGRVDERNVVDAGKSTTEADVETTTQAAVHYLCLQTNLSEETQVRVGLCVFSEPGKLVFGVRQWHGLTSLLTTLIITPLSIFVARYHKGYFMMRDGKIPLRTWYLVHILLIFPTIWMHASGFAALSRQRDVMGYSLTKAAKIHRAVGSVTLSLMGIQIASGFLRPVSTGLRKCVIVFHWLGGYIQHILEVFLCIYSNQIPGSPTNAHSLLNDNRFDNPIHSVSTELFIGWIIFSASIHIFQMIRIYIQDKKTGFGDRSLFPIIVPVLATNPTEVENLQKYVWMDKIVLIIYSLVSGILFFVITVSMYQIFYDKLFYGFGPMTCTHNSLTQLKADDEGC